MDSPHRYILIKSYETNINVEIILCKKSAAMIWFGPAYYDCESSKKSIFFRRRGRAVVQHLSHLRISFRRADNAALFITSIKTRRARITDSHPALQHRNRGAAFAPDDVNRIIEEADRRPLILPPPQRLLFKRHILRQGINGRAGHGVRTRSRGLRLQYSTNFESHDQKQTRLASGRAPLRQALDITCRRGPANRSAPG